MNLHHRCAVAAACLVAILPLPSQATSTAFASLSNFSYELIDLTPDDGFGVSISFYNPQNSVQASNFGQQDIQNGTGNLSAAVNAAGSATGVVDTLSASHFSLTATSSSTGDYTYATGDGRHFMAFTLSANTQMIFTAAANVSMSVTDSGFEDAVGIARMQLEAPGGTGAGFSELVSPSLDSPSGPLSGGKLALITVSYNNTSFEAITGNLTSWARAVTINGSLAPVPEPQTWAMLAAGLLVLGGLARRKRT